MTSEGSTLPGAGPRGGWRGGWDWRGAIEPTPQNLALAVGGAALLALLWFAAQGAYLLLLAPFVLLAGVYVILRRPEVAAPVFAFLLYTNTQAVLVQIHHIPFVVAAAVPLILLIPIARDVILRREPLVITPAVPLILAFLAVQLVGALLARRPDESMEGLVTSFLEGLVLYLLVTNAIRTPAVRSEEHTSELQSLRH